MKKNYFISFALSLAMLIMIVGCGGPEEFGGTIMEGKTTSVKEIMTQTGALEGKVVKVEGKIVTECPSGCWFELKDKSGIVYVDIEPNGLSIPQRVGRNIIVEGVVSTKKRTAPMIVGRKVKIT